MDLAILKVINELERHNMIELLLCNLIYILVDFIQLLKVIAKELKLIVILLIFLIYILLVRCCYHVIQLDPFILKILLHYHLVVNFLFIHQKLILILNDLLLLLLKICGFNVGIVVHLVAVY
jgi:hypothetical protein